MSKHYFLIISTNCLRSQFWCEDIFLLCEGVFISIQARFRGLISNLTKQNVCYRSILGVKEGAGGKLGGFLLFSSCWPLKPPRRKPTFLSPVSQDIALGPFCDSFEIRFIILEFKKKKKSYFVIIFFLSNCVPLVIFCQGLESCYVWHI